MFFSKVKGSILFVVTIILVISSSFPTLAQEKSDDERNVEASWVKYRFPDGWVVAATCPPEYKSKSNDAEGSEYNYWTSATCKYKTLDAFAYFEKLSYPDGKPMTIDTGKHHFIHHKPGITKCVWLDVSKTESKGLVTIKSVKFENGVLSEPIMAYTVFIRKVGNDIYSLEIGFELKYEPEQQNEVTDLFYNSWQPLTNN